MSPVGVRVVDSPRIEPVAPWWHALLVAAPIAIASIALGVALLVVAAVVIDPLSGLLGAKSP